MVDTRKHQRISFLTPAQIATARRLASSRKTRFAPGAAIYAVCELGAPA